MLTKIQAPKNFILINQISFLLFILAGITGIFFRLFYAYSINTGLDAINLRHAHSHLMYFGWATPAIMNLIILNLIGKKKASIPTGSSLVLFILLFVAFLTYLSFLLTGYHPVSIGKAKLPFSVILSGFNVIIWYFYYYYYRKVRKDLPRTYSILLWDMALFFLLFSTVGAWGLALLKAPGILNLFFTETFKHMFLGLASDGFFVLAVLGFIFNTVDENKIQQNKWFLYLGKIIFFSLPLTFFLGMPLSTLPHLLKVFVLVSSILFSLSLISLLILLWKQLDSNNKKKWGFIIAALLLKSLGVLFSSILSESSISSLRLIYLHLMLLAFVSPGIIIEMYNFSKLSFRLNFKYLYIYISMLILSMLPLTTIWPDSYKGHWIYPLPMWISVLLIAEIIRIFILMYYSSDTKSQK